MWCGASGGLCGDDDGDEPMRILRRAMKGE